MYTSGARAITQITDQHATACALQKADTFEAQGLANAAWAFAKLGYRDNALYEVLADAAAFRVEELNAQGLCNVAWALATAGYYQPELATNLAQQVCGSCGLLAAAWLAHTACLLKYFIILALCLVSTSHLATA